MKPCLKHILALPEEFQERLVKNIEALMKTGATQQDANQAALAALIDGAIDEMEAIESALRDQHPDLFIKPKDQAQTPEFKRWFGDSKVVDAEGKPLVVYHGTTKSFDAFQYGTGWFTVDPGEANFWGGMSSDGANVMPAYLSIKNPRILQAETASKNAIYDALSLLTREQDGVLVMEDGRIRWAVVVEPTQIKSATGNNGQFDPANADIRFSRDNTREILGQVIDAKNRTLRRVNPASVLERDISTAASAIERVTAAIREGEQINTEVPVGPTPHVLHMLGAPMQTMVLHTNILRKVLVDKHSEDFSNVSPRELVEAIYKPAMVLKGARPGEWELVTDLKNTKGEPIMVAMMSDAPVQVVGKKGGLTKAMAIKSAYARTLIGKGDTILSRVKSGRLVYAEMEKAHAAVDGGWAQFQIPIADGLRSRTVKDDLALVKFIGDNYKAENSPDGWRDAPAFSRGNFELPEFGFIAQAQQALQDRYNRWKQSVDAVRKQGGTVTEANDFYMAEERYWGQVATRNDEFGDEIRSFVEGVKADGLELSDVALYAYAKHARERNDHIAKQRAAMPDGGSGMTNDAADQILLSAQQSGLDVQLEQHAQTLYDWIDGTRDVLEQGGLISPAQRQAWDNSYRHYVPLRGREDLPEKKRIGSGFNIKGKEGFKAMGRKTEAKQIIEQIIQDRTRAYIRVGKNEVLRSFLNFVLDNPSPNLWQINAVESKPKEGIDANGDPVINEGQQLISDDRTVTVKDGGDEIHILIKDDALREQMQNMHVESVPKVLAALQWANRKIGAMLTSYNPVFVVLNGMRDFQAASMGMVQEAGFKGGARFLAHYSSAMATAAMAEIFDRPSAEYLEYKRAGGTTGYFGLDELGKTEKDLLAMAKNAERGAANPIKLAHAVVNAVDAVNSAVEQATRFASYKAARRSGMTIAKAASVSKNITVNFNRKGTLSGSLGAMILFFNPAVQGTARLAQALASPKVMATMGSGMTALFFLALANAEFGGDDDDGVAFWDKVPKGTKERNIIIMRRPKRNDRGTLEADFIKIPMAYGYNVFATLANELADQYRHSSDPARGRAPIESAKNLAQSLLGATIPANAVAQSLDSTATLPLIPFSNALGPFAQSALNMNNQGKPLFPDYPNEKALPDSSKYTPSQAGTIFQKGAERLNAMTGGNKYEAGMVDISPGELENALRFWGGGITSFALDLGNAFYARQHIERPEPDLRRLPFVKQLYARIDDETDRSFGYEKLAEAEKAIEPMDAARKDGDGDAMNEIEKKYGSLAWSGTQVRAIRQELSRLRKEERRVIADTELSDAERYAQLVDIGGRARLALQRWNSTFNDALREKAAK